MAESTQKKLGRVRPPRVQITYDVETGDAIERKELPFVVGILADLGRSQSGLPPIKDRSFVEIDRDNFDTVIGSIAPRVTLSTKNLLPKAEKDTLSADLSFRGIGDFEPVPVLLQISELSALYRSRCNIRDFLAKLDGNDALDTLLGKLLNDVDADADDAAEIKALGENLRTDAPALVTALAANLEAALIKHLPAKLAEQVAAALGTDTLTLAALRADDAAAGLAELNDEQRAQLARAMQVIDKIHRSPGRW